MISRSLRSLCVAALAGVVLSAGCGGGSSGRQRKSSDGDEHDKVPTEVAAPPPAPPPPTIPTKAPTESGTTSGGSGNAGEKTYTEDELMYLTGVSAQASEEGQSHCAAVLAHGIYDRYGSSVSDKTMEAVRRSFCAQGESSATQMVYDYYNSEQARAGSASGSGGLEIDVFAAWSFAGSGSGSSSSSRSEKVTREQARQAVSSWRSAHCGSTESYSSQDFVQTVTSETIDQGVIDAWKSCVTQAQKGFFCSSRVENDLVLVTLDWEPSQVQLKLLPQLSLTWMTAANLELASNELPPTIGVGSGIAVAFERKDPSKAGGVQLYGHDPSHRVNLACSLAIPARIEGRVMQDPSCGVERYNERRDALCGVEAYNVGSGPACGDPIYAEKATSVCGAATYNQRQSPLCGVHHTDAHDLRFTSFTPPMPFITVEQGKNVVKEALDKAQREGRLDAYCKSNWRESSHFAHSWLTVEGRTVHGNITCYDDISNTCARPEFGVATWKTCRHASHGVEGYPRCRDSAFGVASYKACRHPSFGAEAYKSCWVSTR